MDSEAAAEKLVRQINYGGLVPRLVENGIPRTKAITGIVSLAAGTFFHDMTYGQMAQGMSEWNSALEDRCSEEYARLKTDNPMASKAEINTTPDLETLNGIRRGVRRAMNQAYQQSNRKREVSAA